MNNRGFALLMVMATSVVVLGLAALGLCAVQVRSRLLGDARWRTEGELVAGTALATTRLAQREVLDTLSDGSVVVFPMVSRPDSWSWQATGTRAGPLIRLVVVAQRRGAGGLIVGARRASLLLFRAAADTVRVLGQRARF